MHYIELNGEKYPLRFDMRALKEYKSLSGNDVLVGFDHKTENIIHLAFCGIKSGFLLEKMEFKMTDEELSSVIGIGDLKKLINSLHEQMGIDINKKDALEKTQDAPGEIYGTV